MSVTVRSARARSLSLVVAAVALIAACDRATTEPSSAAKPVDTRQSMEGDTLSCRQGWTVMDGRYVCNEDL